MTSQESRPEWYKPENEMPEFDEDSLLQYALMVLDDVDHLEMLYIDGHPLDSIIKTHLQKKGVL